MSDETKELTDAKNTAQELLGAGGTAPKKKRGFAAMDPKLVSEISRKGGKAAHVKGTAHEFTQNEAREAGRKGGKATHAKRTKKEDPAVNGAQAAADITK